MDVIETEQISPREAVNHWYYRSKFAVLQKEIQEMRFSSAPPSLADFGCGAGVFLQMLVERGLFAREQVIGIDSAYPDPCRLPGFAIRAVPRFPPDSQYDLILLMDILEHLEDDVGGLRHALQHCVPGGYLFLTLPAMKALWSPHDVYLGHQRRYSLRDFRKTAKAAGGVKIRQLYYYYATIFPLAGIKRWLRRVWSWHPGSDMQRTPQWMGWLALGLLQWETVWMRKNHFAGVSVIAVCQKE